MADGRWFYRWVELTGPAIRFIGPAGIVIGTATALLLAGVLGSSAHSEVEAARSIRLAWLAWLIGLAGLCEDRHDGREVVAPVSAGHLVAHRMALGVALSIPIGTLSLILGSRSSVEPALGRLVAEMSAMYLVLAGVSGVARRAAPPGFTALVATCVLVASLVTELVVPAAWRLWPSPLDAHGYGRLPLTWFTAGAIAVTAAFALASKEWRLPRGEHG